MATHPPRPSRLVWSVQALLGAAAGFSVGDVLAGLAVPGDFFDLRSPSAFLPIAVCPLLGGYLASRVRAPRARVALVVVTALCIFGDLSLGAGWWVTPPPDPHRATAPR